MNTQSLHKVELWGTLGQRSTWQVVPTSVMKRLLLALVGGTQVSACGRECV